MRLRNDVVLAPVTRGLKNAVVDEAWLHDTEINWVLGFGKGTVGVDAFVKKLKKDLERKEEGFAVLGIYLKSSPVGFITVEYFDRTAEIFMYIAPPYRGVFNLANTALYWCVKGIFKTTKIFRVQVETLSINKKAIRFLRKFGFKQEGIKKSAYWMGVNSFNVVMLALLKPEFNRLEE